MTREENILTLNEHLEHWKRLLSEKICDQDEGEKTIDALQNAIKALEQEPILDKIRVEIDEQYDRVHPYNISCADGLEMALGIIDKYIAEGSDKE